MEGNFLSRYNNRIETWKKSIENDPDNKSVYETEMSDYIMKCLPYMNQYVDDNKKEVSTDNIFN
jgi:hypothetical protein